MPTYSVQDVIGKTLYAKKTIQLYDQPYDNAQVIREVPAGEIVGIVYSYLEPSEDRTQLYWQFQSSTGFYYATHAVGKYDIENLRDQGLLSTEELSIEPQSNFDKILNTFLKGAAIYAGCFNS